VTSPILRCQFLIRGNYNNDVNKLRQIRRLSATLKAAIRHLLQLGLLGFKKPEGRPFVVHPSALGLPNGLRYDNIEEVIDVARYK
jgi:hypothetical protein